MVFDLGTADRSCLVNSACTSRRHLQPKEGPRKALLILLMTLIEPQFPVFSQYSGFDAWAPSYLNKDTRVLTGMVVATSPVSTQDVEIVPPRQPPDPRRSR